MHCLVAALSILATISVAHPTSNRDIEERQLTNPFRNLLMGPVNFPRWITNVDLRNASLINFQDEVFDISSISIFGNINDYGNCQEASSGTEAVTKAARGEPSVIQANASNGINVDLRGFSLINFGDEVFDISSISIFGDINDGICPPAPAPTPTSAPAAPK